MRSRTRAAALLGAATIGLAAVGPAVAAENGERPVTVSAGAKAEKAKQDAKARQAAKKKAAQKKAALKKARARAWARCDIAEDRLLSAADHPGLARFKKRLDRLEARKRITEARAESLYARRAKQVTVAVAINEARWAPVYRLFGVKDRKELVAAVREAGSMRALRNDLKITLDDLRTARKQGRVKSKGVRAELCRSGKEEKPAEEKPAEEKPTGKEPSKEESLNSPTDGTDSGGPED